LKKQKEEWGNQSGRKGLGKKESEKQGVKAPKRDTLEGTHQHQD
jgi:hypothetical protein